MSTKIKKIAAIALVIAVFLSISTVAFAGEIKVSGSGSGSMSIADTNGGSINVSAKAQNGVTTITVEQDGATTEATVTEGTSKTLAIVDSAGKITYLNAKTENGVTTVSTTQGGTTTDTTAPTEPAEPVKDNLAVANTQSVLVDGETVTFEVYALVDENDGETNYIKLRDLAFILDGTSAQFDVSWDGAVNIIPGQAYSPNGTEMDTPFKGDRTYRPTDAVTKVNGVVTEFDAICLEDDDGGEYNYYKLRDLGKVLGFNVSWSAEQGIYVETDKPYADETVDTETEPTVDGCYFVPEYWVSPVYSDYTEAADRTVVTDTGKYVQKKLAKGYSYLFYRCEEELDECYVDANNEFHCKNNLSLKIDESDRMTLDYNASDEELTEHYGLTFTHGVPSKDHLPDATQFITEANRIAYLERTAAKTDYVDEYGFEWRVESCCTEGVARWIFYGIKGVSKNYDGTYNYGIAYAYVNKADRIKIYTQDADKTLYEGTPYVNGMQFGLLYKPTDEFRWTDAEIIEWYIAKEEELLETHAELSKKRPNVYMPLWWYDIDDFLEIYNEMKTNEYFTDYFEYIGYELDPDEGPSQSHLPDANTYGDTHLGKIYIDEYGDKWQLLLRAEYCWKYVGSATQEEMDASDYSLTQKYGIVFIGGLPSQLHLPASGPKNYVDEYGLKWEYIRDLRTDKYYWNFIDFATEKEIDSSDYTMTNRYGITFTFGKPTKDHLPDPNEAKKRLVPYYVDEYGLLWGIESNPSFNDDEYFWEYVRPATEAQVAISDYTLTQKYGLVFTYGVPTSDHLPNGDEIGIWHYHSYTDEYGIPWIWISTADGGYWILSDRFESIRYR